MNWYFAVVISAAIWMLLYPWILLAAKYFFVIFMGMTGGG